MTAPHPQDLAMDVTLPALMADLRLQQGAFAEQDHLIDPLDAALMALAPHTTRRPEVAAS